MALARKHQIIAGQPGFYQCISRCVRRSYLCGLDPVTGQNYDHRRSWMVNRLKELSNAFAIDVYAYAIMSNHWHVVLHVDPIRTSSWTREEVISRWFSTLNWRTRKTRRPLPHPDQVDDSDIAIWRERLASISWFMKSINEPIARIANAEDECTGHFWEGRFQSRALLHDAAVVTSMCYTDLNPINANAARSLENSDFTSIQHRLASAHAVDPISQNSKAPATSKAIDHQLASPLSAVFHCSMTKSIDLSINLREYVSLLEMRAMDASTKTSRNKQISITNSHSINSDNWNRLVSDFPRLIRRVAGPAELVTKYLAATNRKKRIDVSGNSLIFP